MQLLLGLRVLSKAFRFALSAAQRDLPSWPIMADPYTQASTCVSILQAVCLVGLELGDLVGSRLSPLLLLLLVFPPLTRSLGTLKQQKLLKLPMPQLR